MIHEVIREWKLVIKVIDLFSGVGGMSLGATLAGCTLVGAVELDPIAIDTHKVNFPKTVHLKSDISALTSNDILDSLKLKPNEVTGVIGGPPCQGFSSMGKGNVDDPRNTLFIHFFRLVKELQPEFFLAENVPGILNSKYDHIRQKAISLVDDSYELLKPIKISANDVGAPTTRTRVFFVGFKKSISPKMESVNFKSDVQISNFVGDALSGLPKETEFVDGWTAITKKEGHSYTQILSRNPPTDVGNMEAVNRFLTKNEVSGMIGTVHTEDVIKRFKSVTPGSKDHVSRAPRLKLDGFCPTLRAGTGSDKGSFQAVRPIHPTEPRVITPREAARMQGFPDWFQFHTTKWHSFRQIGNSVSPIVSEFLIKKIIEKII
mgnify:CR=1 FL=1